MPYKRCLYDSVGRLRDDQRKMIKANHLRLMESILVGFAAQLVEVQQTGKWKLRQLPPFFTNSMVLGTMTGFHTRTVRRLLYDRLLPAGLINCVEPAWGNGYALEINKEVIALIHDRKLVTAKQWEESMKQL